MMKYRAEVDGLRAIAVLSVIFYHAGFSMFSGGYVGVDVFFVISGYLITSIVFKALAEGRFSFREFYERRARRILPALFLMLFVSVPFGWVMLLPGDMLEFCRSLVAADLFASNFFFWRQSGYFDTTAELKPLLHTWSLSLEEQFYMFFPILLSFTFKRFKQQLLLVLCVVTLLSFVMCLEVAKVKPTAAYFLLPTRAWELLIGSCVALLPVTSYNHKRFIAEFLSIAGLLMIVGSVIFLDRNTPFPGFFAIPPCVGTALIMAYADERTVVRKFLALPVLVGTGLLSYGAYLWHQPVFVFARLASDQELSAVDYIGLTCLSFSFAYVSWRFIERPFRANVNISRKRVMQVSTFAAVSCIAVGASGQFTRGFPQRERVADSPVMPLAQITDLYDFYDYKNLVRNGSCHSVSDALLVVNKCFDIRKRNVFVIGDSYAAALYSGLQFVRDQSHKDVGVTQLTDGNGPPFFGRGRADSGRDLESINSSRIRFIAQFKPDVVVLHWMVDGANAIADAGGTEKALGVTIAKIKAVAPMAHIIVIGPLPKWSITLQKQLVTYYGVHKTLPPVYMNVGLGKQEFVLDDYFSQTLPEAGVDYVSALKRLCNQKGCITRFSSDITDISAVDWGHLTKKGSIYLAEQLQGLVFN